MNHVSSGVGAVDGLESIFHALVGAVPAYKHFMSEKQRIIQLLHDAGDFKHPAALAVKCVENLKNNGVDISLDIASAVLAYKGQEWDRFGYEVGKILGASMTNSSAVVI